MRRFLAAALTVLAACGKVNNGGDDTPAIDAPKPDAPGVCTVHDTIQSCGVQCAVCEAPGDRTIATCDGTSCGIQCKAGAPTCTDNSCSRLVFDFESNTIDGIHARLPANLALSVRNKSGKLALAIDVTNLTEVSFFVPICLTGNLDVHTRTLKAQVFFDGGTTVGDQYFVQTSAPDPKTGAFLGNTAYASGAWLPYTTALSASQFSNATPQVTFQVGSFGAQFSGTIWLDDIRVE